MGENNRVSDNTLRLAYYHFYKIFWEYADVCARADMSLEDCIKLARRALNAAEGADITIDHYLASRTQKETPNAK